MIGPRNADHVKFNCIALKHFRVKHQVVLSSIFKAEVRIVSVSCTELYIVHQGQVTKGGHGWHSYGPVFFLLDWTEKHFLCHLLKQWLKLSTPWPQRQCRKEKKRKWNQFSHWHNIQVRCNWISNQLPTEIHTWPNQTVDLSFSIDVLLQTI